MVDETWAAALNVGGAVADQWRALDAPFTQPDEWAPVPGTCSRCHQPAALGERRWWHLGPVCRARPTDRLTQPVQAEFIPA